MLFVNRSVPVATHKMQTGNVCKGVYFGEYMPGVNREFIVLPPVVTGSLENRFYEDLTIRKTRKGHFCIDTRDDYDNLYLLLSSQLTPEANRIGNIRVPRHQRTEMLAQYKYATRSGRGRWCTVLVRAYPDDVFYVTWNHPSKSELCRDMIYIVTDDLQVVACRLNDTMIACRDANIKALPFAEFRNCTVRLDKSEWRKI